MPSCVVVKYDRCILTLNLPVFFEQSYLETVHKVFKMMADRPYQNEQAVEVLDQFFPLWEQDLAERLTRAEDELTAAKQDAENKRRTLAALGSTVDVNIAQAKRANTSAQRRKKKHPDAAIAAKDALKLAMRPKTDLEQAVKEVKRLEAIIKATKADKERCGKIINAYNIKVIKGE